MQENQEIEKIKKDLLHDDYEEPIQKESSKIGKAYIGTKVIIAEPMTHEDWLRSQNKWQDGQESCGDGYKVQYEDGYLSWSPKNVFERCYRELTQQEIVMVLN